jgi:glycosyltransferase involved in cell wall biosynthesis
MTVALSECIKSNALVTVVLPAYNHAKYVVEAIDSIRAQTFDRWELIVIDDGSTDDTLAILQNHVAQCGDPRIRLLAQTNAGSHATLNRGMDMAKTPYLAILNSDDRYASTRLERLINQAQTSSNDTFIVTGLRLIDGNGQPLPETHWWNAMYQDILQRWRASKASAKNPAIYPTGITHCVLQVNFLKHLTF